MTLEFSTEWRNGHRGDTWDGSGTMGKQGGEVGEGEGGGGVRGEGWSDGVLE